MRINLYELMDCQDVLFGAAMGRACLARLLEDVREPEEPSVLFIDFARVVSATVSFLREGPLGYRELLRSQASNLYVVFANLTPATADSLDDFLTSISDAVFTCQLTRTGTIQDVHVVGQLEPKQSLTFQAVRDLGEVTASELAKKRGDSEDVKVTAWNNRLAALASKGLVMEFRSGRSKSFRVTLEEA